MRLPHGARSPCTLRLSALARRTRLPGPKAGRGVYDPTAERVPLCCGHDGRVLGRRVSTRTGRAFIVKARPRTSGVRALRALASASASDPNVATAGLASARGPRLLHIEARGTTPLAGPPSTPGQGLEPQIPAPEAGVLPITPSRIEGSARRADPIASPKDSGTRLAAAYGSGAARADLERRAAQPSGPTPLGAK